MTDTLFGIFIGFTTSFIVGVFLIWKGENLVKYLQKLPTEFRIELLTKAFLSALHDYPYRKTFQHFLGFVAGGHTVLIGLYIVMTIYLFKLDASDLSVSNGTVKEALRSQLGNFLSEWAPWISLLFTVLLVFLLWRFIKFSLIESVVPRAYSDFKKIRECIRVKSSPDEFVEYVNLESRCETAEDIILLMKKSQTILAGSKLNLPNHIISGLSDRKWGGMDDHDES